jgi:hypothetical protein
MRRIAAPTALLALLVTAPGVVRGVVELSWRDEVLASGRRKGKRARRAVMQRRVLLTETGKTAVEGADPAGMSKAMCLIW